MTIRHTFGFVCVCFVLFGRLVSYGDTFSQIQFDSDVQKLAYFQAQAAFSTNAIYQLASDFERDWSDRNQVYYARLTSTLAMAVINKKQDDEAVLQYGVRLAENILPKIRALPLLDADEILERLGRPTVNTLSGPKSVVDYLDRTAVTDTYLFLIKKVNDGSHFYGDQSPQTSGQIELLPVRPPVPPGIPQINQIPLSSITNEVLKAAYDASIDNWREKVDRRSFVDRFSSQAFNRESLLQGEFSSFVKAHFSVLPEDLDILEKAFNQHIKNPELREKLILKCFNGNNPFKGRPGYTESSAAAKSGDLRSRIEAQLREGARPAAGASGQPAGSRAAGSGAQTAVGLLTTPGGMAGSVATLGAGIVLFILWRARARRKNS